VCIYDTKNSSQKLFDVQWKKYSIGQGHMLYFCYEDMEMSFQKVRSFGGGCVDFPQVPSSFLFKSFSITSRLKPHSMLHKRMELSPQELTFGTQFLYSFPQLYVCKLKIDFSALGFLQLQEQLCTLILQCPFIYSLCRAIRDFLIQHGFHVWLVEYRT